MLLGEIERIAFDIFGKKMKGIVTVDEKDSQLDVDIKIKNFKKNI